MIEGKFSYDRLAYSNHLFTQTHPDSFATVARLHGLRSPDVHTARVLELGCGMGLNLISQAYTNPNAEFIGIDLAKNHIEYAKVGVKELGLKNIEFRQIDLMQLDINEFGKFDYIFAHGLFSWVPDLVRSKILTLYREMLTEKGIGFLSYNAYPGWHFKKVSAELLKIHTREISEPEKKVTEAREFLKFLGENLVNKDVYNFCVQNEIQNFETLPDTSVFHDALAEINTPFYFSEFAKLLTDNGLQFLSEVELVTRSGQEIPQEAKKMLEGIDDIVQKEQYFDFFTGRVFRQTLFCHSDIKLTKTRDPSVMDDFYVASSLAAVSAKPEYYTNKVEKFANIAGNEVQIDLPTVKTALKHLNEIWGEAVKFSELLESVRTELKENDLDPKNWDEQLDAARQIFLQFVDYSSLLEIHTNKQEIKTKVGDKPKISPLVRWQLNEGIMALTGYRRAIKIEDNIVKNLLLAMDGTITLHEVSHRMRKLIDSDDTIQNKDQYAQNLSKTFEQNMERFEKIGLFVD